MSTQEGPSSGSLWSELEELRALPPIYTGLGPVAALQRAEELFRLWMPILERDDTVVGLPRSGSDNEVAACWRDISLVVGRHFASALVAGEPATRSGRKKEDWNPFLFSLYDKLLTSEYGFDASVERRLLVEYLQATWNCHLMELLGSPAMGRTPVGWDKFVFWELNTMACVSLKSGRPEHLTLGAIFTAHLTERARNATEVRDQGEIEHRNQAFGSLVLVQELGLLAGRNENMLERYGAKQVEERFEQQLALLMQSFGFLVVPAKRGERRVDLVCLTPITTEHEESFTILVEAKSARGTYTLPTKDSRAIAEYVRDTKRALATLPPVKMVLIIGPAIASTVPGKLRNLEGEVGIPVRYAGAHLLAELRRRSPGPIPTTAFLASATQGDHVLGGRLLQDVIEAEKRITESHATFISSLLAGARTT
jgi:hypothetical protein